MKDSDVEIDTWINEADESEKVKKVLKIFFTLNSAYNNQEWCMFPTILDDELFWTGAKNVLNSEAANLGKSFKVI